MRDRADPSGFPLPLPLPAREYLYTFPYELRLCTSTLGTIGADQTRRLFPFDILFEQRRGREIARILDEEYPRGRAPIDTRV